MSKLEVKTRGNSKTGNQPRVFFACHPADQKDWLDVIAQDLFEVQNYAVYYAEDMAESVSQMEADERTQLEYQLMEMNLLIFAVTRQFLRRPNPAKDFIFGYGLNHGIPVLPILLEPELDDLYAIEMNRVGEGYGQIQYLDRCAEEKTVSSYREKLKNYLSSVLISDDLEERVRSAFYAYLFLSYRKKDRAQGQELMKLIHKIPYCEDIAIWYDDYLTPGENWSDAIAETIANSAMVILAVTQSIVEAPNYIIDQEFPAAKRMNKTILPARIFSVSRSDLEKLFDGIPEDVDATDEEALKNAIVPVLGAMIKKEDISPEHNYLIGLAYLNGISVERDPEHGIRLITSAAEQGYYDAADYMAQIYRFGIGTSVNEMAALKWKRECVSLREKAYAAERTKACGEALYRIRLDYAAWLKEAGEPEKAEEAYLAILPLAAELPEKFGRKYMRCTSWVYDRLGDLMRSTYRYDEARAWYLKGMDHNKSVKGKATGESYVFGISMSFRNLGSLAEAQGEYEKAARYFERSCMRLEKLVEVSERPRYKKALAEEYESLGCNAFWQGDYEKAAEWSQKSVLMYERIANEKGDPDSLEDLNTSYYHLIESCIPCNKSDEGEFWLGKAIRNLELMRPFCKEDQEKLRLCRCYQDYANFGGLIGCFSAEGDQLRLYLTALEIAEEMAKERENFGNLLILTDAYRAAGRIYQLSEKIEISKEYFEKAIQTGERLFAKTEGGSELTELISCYTDRISASVCPVRPSEAVSFDNKWQDEMPELKADPGEARLWYERAEECFRKHFSETQIDTEFEQDMILVHNKLLYECMGEAANAAGLPEEKAAWMMKAESVTLTDLKDSGKWVQLHETGEWIKDI